MQTCAKLSFLCSFLLPKPCRTVPLDCKNLHKHWCCYFFFCNSASYFFSLCNPLSIMYPLSLSATSAATVHRKLLNTHPLWDVVLSGLHKSPEKALMYHRPYVIFKQAEKSIHNTCSSLFPRIVRVAQVK